jgi:dTDP-4-dehydrorhamnose 3,5-epimerase
MLGVDLVDVLTTAGEQVTGLRRDGLDVRDPAACRRAVAGHDVVVNAAAYTAVDAAETPEGRTAAWAVNVTAVSALAQIAVGNGLTLVHVSSDYVFDGTLDRPYREDDPLSPLGVYAQTKAAGDAVVSAVPRHYIVRTSWVVGEGKNFVRTMASLAERGIDPKVVADQIGRLTFTDDLARGILHLLSSGAPCGTYNLTGSGEPTSWADVARAVFTLTGNDPARVSDVSTEQYFADAAGPVAPRPRNSLLDLGKLTDSGFQPRDSAVRLRDELAR